MVWHQVHSNAAAPAASLSPLEQHVACTSLHALQLQTQLQTQQGDNITSKQGVPAQGQQQHNTPVRFEPPRLCYTVRLLVT